MRDSALLTVNGGVCCFVAAVLIVDDYSRVNFGGTFR